MNSRRRTVSISPNDLLERLIFERHLCIVDVVMRKELNAMVIFLNTHKLLNLKISDYPRLKNANQKQLDKWKLIAGGVGIHWEELDEDLSLKGFINAYIKEFEQEEMKMKKGKTPPNLS